MRKALIMLVLTAIIFPIPAYSGMVGAPDPVEKSLQDVQQSESLRMTEDFKKEMEKPDQPQAGEKASGSNGWKWALGIAVIGGAAAAAGGGGGDSGSSGSGDTGSITATW